MSNWRPKNWEEIVKGILSSFTMADNDEDLIEAGADAMLEALFEINKGNWMQLKKDKEGNFYILAEGL